MASKLKGTSLQHFSEEKLTRWRERLQHVTKGSGTQNGLEEIFEDVFQSRSQQEQLKAIKKIRSCLTTSTDTSCRAVCTTALEILTEIHSLCDSRHPLQRAIVSIFQGLLATEREAVLKIIAANIVRVFSESQPDYGVSYSEYSAVVERKVEYLEALMENFKLGEAALKQQLPIVLKYCVLAILTLSNCKSSSHSMGLLMAVLKATINLMHKLATVIGRMLSSEPNDIHELSWPDELKQSSCLERNEWTCKQLSDLEVSCDNLLIEVDSIPHDASVAAAMLLFVIFNINHSPSFQSQSTGSTVQYESVLCSKLQHWFSDHLKPFAQLAVCHGVLAKLPPSLLLTTQMEEGPLLVALFPRICKLFDSFTETSDRYLASRTIALWTTVTKDCAEGISPSSVLYHHVLPSGEIMQKLLQLVWSLWEDPIDGIRHQCRDMFENAVKIYQQLQNSGCSEDYLMTLAKDLLSLESPTRGKFILLSSLSHHLPADKFLQVSARLPTELLSVMGHQALACHAGDLWTSLVFRHWKEVNDDPESGIDVWNETWVNPLVQAMCTAAPPARKHIVQHCLPALFQCLVNCMQYITSHLRSLESVSADSKLTARLACLRCAKMECKDFDAAATDSFADLFATAMHHADEQIRLSALGLLCESHRTTEPPLLSHLKLLYHFIELNANSQSPGFRYPALTAFKKLFIRIRDSSYAMLKLHQKGRCENPEAQIASFQSFLRELMSQQFAVLHPLSSFQRRSFSLSLLQLMASIFNEPNSSSASNPTGSISEDSTISAAIPSVFDLSSAISSSQAKCLLDGLQDAFDANRSVCLELLLKLPLEMIGFTDSAFVHRQTAAYLSLVQSPKSVSCTTAAFQLKLFLQKCCTLFCDCLARLLDQGEVEQDRAKPPFFVAVNLLCKLLNQHISEAKKDLVKSSMSSPMYGIIQSIRAAYECVGTATYARDCQHHCEAMATVVSICNDVATIVSPVVCSSSPEGFLPDAEGEPSLTEDSSTSPASQGNAQSLLLCCWHSMKEIALLFGYLTEYTPVISDATSKGQNGVITHSQLDTIAKIFIHQLTEARHRGAFEMAYSGFSKLCRCLWTSSSPELNQKPQKWVQDLLESLQSTSLARLLSITRRSAGLPFYLQAILTAEPAHTGRVCLKSTMETLLRVAAECTSSPRTAAAPEQGMTEQSTTVTTTTTSSQPAAVHALNILRALYRDSRLGEHIVPFIPEGVVIAIEGFSAPLWPVRNSSTLLFSALVTRIFGAKRVQDEHSVENKMTAKEFFTRFPTLHKFLLKQLEEGVRQMGMSKEDSLQPSLFPVLLLLSRLYPSPLDEANSPISMKPFLPLLINCTCCSVWKTRVLVAHTITSMITEQNAPSLLGDLYGRMDLTNQNRLHGLLLVIEMVVRDRPKLLKCTYCAEEREYTLSSYLLSQLLNKKYLTSRKNLCRITSGSYLRVLLSLLNICKPSFLDRTQLDQLEEILTNCYQAVQACHFKQLIDKDLGVLQLELLFWCSSCDHLANLVVGDAKLEPAGLMKMCLHDGYPLALRTFCLEFINRRAAAETFCDDVIVEHVFSSLCSESDPDYLIQAYSFASNQSAIRKRLSDTSLNEVIQKAHELSLHPCNRLELKISLICFLSSVLGCVDPNISSKYLRGLVSHWEAICIPTQPYEIRVAVARELPCMWSAILSSPHRNDVIPTCCQLVLNLLQDSDIDVRTHMAVSVAKILPAGVGLSVESPNPSSALEWFIESIPVIISDLDLALSTLLRLVPGDPDITSSGGSSNPLFDEDPINEYTEDVVLLQHITSCLRDTLNKRKELTQDLIMAHLNPKNPNIGGLAAEGGEDYSQMSAWENPKLFMKLVKRYLLQNVLRTSVRAKEQRGSTLTHPIFM